MIDINTASRLIDIFAATILVTAFLTVSSRSLSFYVRLFALQSLLLGMVALLVVLGYGEMHILIAAILTIAVKAIAIPVILNKIIDKINVQKEIELSINIPSSLLICGALVILANSVAEPILSAQHQTTYTVSKVLPSSIAMMLIGLFIMMTRKKGVTQIVGLLTMENVGEYFLIQAALKKNDIRSGPATGLARRAAGTS